QPRVRPSGGPPKHPETGVGHYLQPSLTVLGNEVVLAITEEREMAVVEPGQECLHRLQFNRVNRRRLPLELIDQAHRAFTHRGGILDHQPYVAEYPLDAVAELAEAPAIGLAHHLGVHDPLTDRVLRLSARFEHLLERPA